MTRRPIGLVLIALSVTCSTGGGHADFDLKKVPGSTVIRNYAVTIE